MKLQNKIILTILICVIAIQPCFAVTLSNEFLFTAKKFIMAMLGVAISSLLIFIGLSLYNKFFHNPKTQESTTFDEKSLEKATTLDVAISNFLNKTKL